MAARWLVIVAVRFSSRKRVEVRIIHRHERAELLTCLPPVLPCFSSGRKSELRSTWEILRRPNGVNER